MLDKKQVLEHIIRPTLELLDMGGEAAEILVLGTGLAESKLSAIVQYGGGPAQGIYQMEPPTHDDIWTHWLKSSKKRLVRKTVENLIVPGISRSSQLKGNLYYATAMCRLHYRRVPAALPPADDPELMAKYHKKYYNTYLGKADPEVTVMDFAEARNVVFKKGEYA